MSDHDQHCPFLNRSDARCSKNFSLDRLNNTYHYCFGKYTSCSVYLELLVERRLRRLEESAGVLRTRASRLRWTPETSEASDATSPFIQITHAGRQIKAA